MENNYDNLFNSPKLPSSNKILDQDFLDSIFLIGDSPLPSDYIRSDYDSIKINEFQNNLINPDTKILFNEDPNIQTENYASSFRKMFREPHKKKQNRKNSISLESKTNFNLIPQNEILNQKIDKNLNKINGIFLQICSQLEYDIAQPFINNLKDLELYLNHIFENMKSKFDSIQFSLPFLLMTMIFETLKLTFSSGNNNIKQFSYYEDQEEKKDSPQTISKTLQKNTQLFNENEIDVPNPDTMVIDLDERSEQKLLSPIPNSPSNDRISEIPKNEQYYINNMKQASSYYALITSALNQLTNHRGTLEDILNTIKTINAIDITSEFKKSISQCLNKRFKKIPGIYTLEKNVPILDIRGLKTVTDRLIYILQNLPYQEGDIKIIKTKYKELIGEKMNDENNVWEKTIIKTLKKRPEFNKSASKALFTFDS